MDWERRQAQLAASEALGWSTQLDLNASSKSLNVTLTDNFGRTLEGAAVRATIFHHARRSQAQELLLQPTEQGRYRALVSNAREGQWQVRLRIQRGPDLYFQTQDIYAPGVSVAHGGMP